MAEKSDVFCPTPLEPSAFVCAASMTVAPPGVLRLQGDDEAQDDRTRPPNSPSQCFQKLQCFWLHRNPGYLTLHLAGRVAGQLPTKPGQGSRPLSGDPRPTQIRRSA